MKPTIVLILAALAFNAVPSPAEEPVRPAETPRTIEGVQALGEFWKWFVGGCCFTSLAGACGLIASMESPGPAPYVVGVSIGAVGSLAAALLSSSGRTSQEVAGLYVFPVILGDLLGCLIVPGVVVALILSIAY